MGTSIILLFFASFSLLCAGVSSSLGCLWEPVRLSFASVRGGHRQSAPPQLFPDSPCGGEMTRLTCSEGRYPDDLTCNTGLMRENPNWEGRSSIFVIEVKYDHETVENCSCSLNFHAGDRKTGTNFMFTGAECTRDIPDETVPRFWMSKVTSLKIHLISNYTLHMCYDKDFIFVREEVQEERNDRLGIPPPPVKFVLDSYKCIDYHSAFVGGRIPPATYDHDGRRYRPAST